jgi:hypothetical protein
MDYAEIIRQLTHLDEDDKNMWIIEDIIDHSRWGKGPRKGKIDACVKWKDYDETSWEPMEIIKEDDPVTLAHYAQDQELLEKSIWKWTKRYLSLSKTSQSQIVQLHAKKAKLTTKFKFGERVPRSIKEAYKIDQENNSTGWYDVINKETSLLKDKYNCFKILEPGEPAPQRYQFIKLLWTFDVKVDGRKRARQVGGGHMTEKLDYEETTSTRMIALDTVRLAFLSMTLLGLLCITGDVNSAYLLALTKERVYTIAGPEYGSIQGRVMIIDKSLDMDCKHPEMRGIPNLLMTSLI